MRYKILSLSDKYEWKDYLNKLPIEQQDVYYIPEYYELYENYGDGKAQCFVFEKDGEIALYPYLINSINNLGYNLEQEYFDIQGAYGYNGVVSSSYSQEFIDAFYQAFNEFCMFNNIVSEFTRYHPMVNNAVFSNNNLNVFFDRETIGLDLTNDYNFIWENEYSSNNRNMIRKAQKLGYGAIFHQKPTSEMIDDFVKLYHYNMNRVNAEKYLFFNVAYFNELFDKLGKHSLLCNIVNSDNKIICSSIFYQANNYFHYHLSGRHENADNSVNNFILDEAVKFAKKNGVLKFHLGGGRTSNQNDSLLKFKGNFSKTHFNFLIGKKIHNQFIYKSVIEQWQEKYPESYNSYSNRILGYREI